jgi:hypothetical protein
MMKKSEGKDVVLVKFTLLSMEKMIISVNVNRFLPLINYKRNIETESKIDLYGRQLIFQVSNNQNIK